jgi:hypothetical protein
VGVTSVSREKGLSLSDYGAASVVVLQLCSKYSSGHPRMILLLGEYFSMR